MLELVNSLHKIKRSIPSPLGAGRKQNGLANMISLSHVCATAQATHVDFLPTFPPTSESAWDSFYVKFQRAVLNSSPESMTRLARKLLEMLMI